MKNISVKDERWLSLAIQLAERSTHDRYWHGAVLVSSGRPFAGWNTFRNSPTVDYQHSTKHAEVAAIERAGSLTERSVLYVARIDRNGNPALSLPCESCMEALHAARVKRVVYTSQFGPQVFYPNYNHK